MNHFKRSALRIAAGVAVAVSIGTLSEAAENVELAPDIITRLSAGDEETLGIRLALSLHNERFTAVWPDNSVALGGNPDIPNLDLAALTTRATASGVLVGPAPTNLTALATSQRMPSIARNPANPRHLVVAASGAQGNPSTPGIVLATSLDDGATWSSRVMLPGRHSPEVGFDGRGTLFLMAIDSRSFVTAPAVLFSSIDGGETLMPLPSPSPPIVLRPHLAVDSTSLWLIAHDFNGTMLASRAPVTAPGQLGEFVTEMLAGTAEATQSDIAIGPQGEALIVYENRPTATIEARLDRDGIGPASFGPATIISNFNAANELALPRVAFDHSSGATRGRAYVIYQEEPRLSQNKEIHMRYSEDRGASWTAAILLNDNPLASQRLVPTLAVDATNGNVGAIWFDFRDRLPTEARVFAVARAAPGRPAQPNSPLNLSARGISTSEIRLDWTDRSDNESGFVIERQANPFVGFAVHATVGANVTSHVDSGLGTQTGFTYRVRAFNAAGNSAFTNEAGGMTLAVPPGAPSGLTVIDQSTAQAQVLLRWADNSVNEQGFHIERSSDGVSFVALATAGPDFGQFTDFAVNHGGRFFYRVRSFNSGGVSAFSNTAGVLLDGPTALSARAISSSRIDLSWTDNSARETAFRIERSRDGRTWSEIASVAADTTTFSDRKLRRDTLFYYRVRAQHADGFTGYTNYSFARTAR